MFRNMQKELGEAQAAVHLFRRRYGPGQGKVVPVLNWAPCHEHVLGGGGQRYGSTHS